MFLKMKAFEVHKIYSCGLFYLAAYLVLNNIVNIVDVGFQSKKAGLNFYNITKARLLLLSSITSQSMFFTFMPNLNATKVNPELLSISASLIEYPANNLVDSLPVKKVFKMYPDSDSSKHDLVFDRMRNYNIKPDSRTKYFTIDENTGEIWGYNLLQVYELNTNKKDSLNRSDNVAKFKKLLPVMEKSWIGTKGTSRSVEFPEGEEHYPDHAYFSKNDEFIIVPDGNTHGGTVDKVYFFNRDGKLLKNYELGYHLNSPSYGFNREKTFFILSNSVGPEYYIFYPNGKIFRSGIFDVEGTSYSMPYISKTGKYYLLNNNLNYFYSSETDQSPISIFSNQINEINEENAYGLSYRVIDRRSSLFKVEILDLVNKRCLFQSNEINLSKSQYRYKFRS